MRREKRPFVVEVKRGQKRGASMAEAIAADVKPDSQRRAEEALFGGSTAEQSGADSSPPRRILEAVAPEPEPEVEIEAPRRGRKPGSKNKPKAAAPVEAPSEKRRRGRPSRNPEGAVRSVVATPELTSAALRKIAQIAKPVPVSPVPGGAPSSGFAAEASAKRKRGRPRKAKPPKFDWAEWSDMDGNADGEDLAVVEATILPPPPPPAQAVAPLPPLTRLSRVAAPRLRAGERWKRRLRIPGGHPRTRVRNS